MTSIEYCCLCDDPTGRAGRAEDSLYLGEDGPYCEECFDSERDRIVMKHSYLVREVRELKAERDSALAEVERLRLTDDEAKAILGAAGQYDLGGNPVYAKKLRAIVKRLGGSR